MSQCPYVIKEKRPDFVLWHCKREEGHPSDGPDNGHRASLPVMSRGDRSMPVFEGVWHKPGEKNTAEPEPTNPAVVSVWQSTRPPRILKEATSNSNLDVRSTK
jgi:hypothetical protein